MDTVKDVDIDKSGRFKYILIKVTDPKSGKSKFIVRGYARAEFHDDVLGEVEPGILSKGLEVTCTGGGRIEFVGDKDIKVYGHSIGFGLADHKKTVEILKKVYPSYNITASNDGY